MLASFRPTDSPASAVFEGPYGCLALFEGNFDLEPGAGEPRPRLAHRRVQPQPFPPDATHGGIETQRHCKLRSASPQDDVEYRDHGPAVIVRLVGRPLLPGQRREPAARCMAYAVAKVLQKQAPIRFSRRGARRSRDACPGVTHSDTSDSNPDPNALAPQGLRASKDGRTFEWRCETMLANPARPLTRDQHLAKFTRCLDFAATLLPARTAKSRIDTVDNLEERVTDATVLATLAAGLVPS